MKKHYTITEVKKRIFLLSFKDQYDCNMTFLRYQEFYESPNSKFRGKSFSIVDFMEWYSKNSKAKCFTYPIDWGGFNIPGPVIKCCLDTDFDDWNRYDSAMQDAYYEILENHYDDGNFYIIGMVGNKGPTLKHEVAHGLFYTRPEYKKTMKKLVSELKPSFKKSMCKTLKEMGYTPKVYIDEIQAYLSTGLTSSFKVKLKNEAKPFETFYNWYYNNA